MTGYPTLASVSALATFAYGTAYSMSIIQNYPNTLPLSQEEFETRQAVAALHSELCSNEHCRFHNLDSTSETQLTNLTNPELSHLRTHIADQILLGARPLLVPDYFSPDLHPSPHPSNQENP